MDHSHLRLISKLCGDSGTTPWPPPLPSSACCSDLPQKLQVLYLLRPDEVWVVEGVVDVLLALIPPDELPRY